MLQPKRTKYRKQQKGRNTGNAVRGSSISFGTYALKAISRGQLTSRQIEAARRAMTRKVKRGAKIWIRVFPDKPITKKPLEVRQGKGKGNGKKGGKGGGKAAAEPDQRPAFKFCYTKDGCWRKDREQTYKRN